VDKEFLSFCYLVINFFSQKTIEETAQELLDCINCTLLLRDQNEIIFRILLREADDRVLNLKEYLMFISDFRLSNPEIVQIPIEITTN